MAMKEERKMTGADRWTGMAARMWPLLAIALLAGRVAARDGGQMGGGDRYQGGAGMMNHGEMHSDDMMEQMSMMIDQMSQMVEEIHGFHAHLAETWTDQVAEGDDRGTTATIMMAMADEMDRIGPHMKAMIENLHLWMDDETDSDTDSDAMNELMEEMNTMIKAGNGVMKVIDGVGAEEGEAHQTDHAGGEH